MPSQRVVDAAHVAPYITYGVTHHGQATDNGRTHQAKPKKSSRQKPERNARSEEDMRFDTGPRPLRNLVANREARRTGRTRRQDRGRNGGFLNNEDTYPDYPPPTFLEAMSTLPLSACTSTTTLVTMTQPVTNLQDRPPDLPPQSPSPSISSILPQVSEPPNSSDLDSDDSLEILDTDSVQAQIDNDVGQRAKEHHRTESPHPPGTPRGRTKSRKPAILDSDSDDIGEIIRPPQANAKRRSSLSPLRTLYPYQPMVAQGRALSAHPSPSNSPYSSRSSFPFLSTTSLKSMSTSTLLKFPMTPTSPGRSESFVSRKLSSFKGKERARSESLETWEVVEPETANMTTADPMQDLSRPILPSQGQGCEPLSPNMSRSVPVKADLNGTAEQTNTSRSVVGTHPLSLRDRKAPPVPFVSREVRRSAPPPPIHPVPSVLDPVSTPTSPISQTPTVSNVHNRLINSSPTPKMKRPQVVCASPLGVNRWREDEADTPPPSPFQRALATPLPPTPVEPAHPRPADVATVTSPTRQMTVFSSSKISKPTQTPLSPLTALSDGMSPPDTPDPFTLDPSLSPTLMAQRLYADSEIPNGRHYPGRPLPRPPGLARTLIDSTYAPYEDFEVNGNVLPEGLLIDFNDTSLTNSSTSRASTPPADQERCRTPIQLSAVSSTSSASSMELVEPVRDVSLPSQRDTHTPTTQSSTPAQFLEVTDLDVLISRLHEEQHNGSDYEALLMLSDFIGPGSPDGTMGSPRSFSTDSNLDKVNVPLLGDVEVERRRKTKDGRIKLKLMLLDTPVDKCGICLMQFRGNNVARLGSICRHAFHDKCLGQWLVRSNTCPMCRVPFANQV